MTSHGGRALHRPLRNALLLGFLLRVPQAAAYPTWVMRIPVKRWQTGRNRPIDNSRTQVIPGNIDEYEGRFRCES